MKKIILDTNFLLIPGKFKIDIFSEINKLVMCRHELFVIDKTIDELNKIINDKDAKMDDRRNAKIGLGLIHVKKIKIIPSEGKYVDDLIVDEADSDTYVATSDSELKRRLKGKIAGFIVLRKKQYLKLECL